jgi:hypothetical protein
MHPSSLPLVLSSLSFVFPYALAYEYENYASAFAWGFLTTTSTLVHITKRPFHLYGPGNCIPWLYSLDVLALYICVARALIDGFYGGFIGMSMAVSVISYAGIIFYTGHAYRTFVYDSNVLFALLSHLSVHLLASFGAVGVICLRHLALKNG